jgi:putative oxidoreductase
MRRVARPLSHSDGQATPQRRVLARGSRRIFLAPLEVPEPLFLIAYHGGGVELVPQELLEVGSSLRGAWEVHVKIQERFVAPTFTLFRIVTGVLFACHGAQKLFGWFGGLPGFQGGRTLPPLLVAAGVIELITGTLIALGLFGAIAAFIASGEMAFAYFIAHFPHGFWPIFNRGELAVLYCFAFLFIATYGPGSFSVDQLIRRRRAATQT